MLRILKNIKNNFIILISLFLISPVLAVGKPSSKYDGAYTFSVIIAGGAKIAMRMMVANL